MGDYHAGMLALALGLLTVTMASPRALAQELRWESQDPRWERQEPSWQRQEPRALTQEPRWERSGPNLEPSLRGGPYDRAARPWAREAGEGVLIEGGRPLARPEGGPRFMRPGPPGYPPIAPLRPDVARPEAARPEIERHEFDRHEFDRPDLPRREPEIQERGRLEEERPAPVRTCYSNAQTRERIAALKLREPFAMMRAAAGFAQAEALSGSLCRWRDSDVYEIALLRRDGRVIHVFIDATSGEIVGSRNER